MKNNKGFAITSIIYAMLILFLGLILLILGNLASRKAMFDKEKNEILSRFNGDEAGLRKYKNGEVVYFDVTTGNICTSSDYTEANSNTGYNGINPSDEQTSCLKFYAFNDDGKDTVKLILDHNTTAAVPWNSSGSNAEGPITLLAQLQSDTKLWQGTKTPSNYTMDQTGQKSNAKYTIDYSGYKARLITAGEIATITGNTSWDEKLSTSGYYFYDNSTTEYKGAAGTNKYAWLFDNINNCTTYGCNVAASSTYGYRTASSYASDSYTAWSVIYEGCLYLAGSVGSGNGIGVRPVIEVLKSKLSSNTELCTLVSGKAYEIGSKYECELGDNDIKTFFVLETNGDNVSLIMDRNIDSNGKGTTSGNTVAWCKSGSNNSCAADGALEYLKNGTTGWTKLTESQISLPSASQIATASGKTFNDSSVSGLPTWLYGNLNSSSAPNTYWTSTPDASLSDYAWDVGYDGTLNLDIVDFDDYDGVRPVITVSKTNLS